MRTEMFYVLWLLLAGNAGCCDFHMGDSQVGDCEDYNQCSAPCGGGFQVCERTCFNGNFGDADCPNDHKFNLQICNTQQCRNNAPTTRAMPTMPTTLYQKGCPDNIVIAGLSMDRLNGNYELRETLVNGRALYRWKNGIHGKMYSIKFNGQSGNSGEWIIGQWGVTDELVRSRTNTMCAEFGIATEELWNNKWSVIADPVIPGSVVPVIDAWVSCRKNEMSPYLIKCYNNGTFEINGKSGDEITLPSCDPIGCRPADLGPFNTDFDNIQKPQGCTKGYITVDGVTLEKHNNNCERQCRDNPDILSAKKIKCFCDFDKLACEYVIKLTKRQFKYKFGNKGKSGLRLVHWKTEDHNGFPFIATDTCPTTTKEQSINLPFILLTTDLQNDQ